MCWSLEDWVFMADGREEPEPLITGISPDVGVLLLAAVMVLAVSGLPDGEELAKSPLRRRAWVLGERGA